MSDGGGYEGVRVREFWPHWIWGVCSFENSSHHVLQCCFCSCLCFSVYPCIIAETLYNCSIWPPFDTTHTYEKNLFMSYHICPLFIVEVFQPLFLFALSKWLKTAWKHSTFCRKKTSSYHTVTPTISKECNGCVPKGEKSRVCPAKYRLTAHYEGFPKTAMWSEMHGKGVVWKNEEQDF